MNNAASTNIESLSHGLHTLDAAAQMLTQATQQKAPAAMIRGMAAPVPGWIDETKAFLPLSSIEEEQLGELEMALFSLNELNGILQEKLDAGADTWGLYVAADAMQQTTLEMLEVLDSEVV